MNPQKNHTLETAPEYPFQISQSSRFQDKLRVLARLDLIHVCHSHSTALAGGVLARAGGPCALLCDAVRAGRRAAAPAEQECGHTAVVLGNGGRKLVAETSSLVPAARDDGEVRQVARDRLTPASLSLRYYDHIRWQITEKASLYIHCIGAGHAANPLAPTTTIPCQLAVVDPS